LPIVEIFSQFLKHFVRKQCLNDTVSIYLQTTSGINWNLVIHKRHRICCHTMQNMQNQWEAKLSVKHRPTIQQLEKTATFKLTTTNVPFW